MSQKFWWLNLVRGIVALIIGMLILGWPQSAQSIFLNFLAMYWLTSGLVSLRWGRSTHQKKGLWLVDGLLEIIVGASILLRPAYAHALNPILAIRGFGVVAVIVGLSRIFSGSTTVNMARQRSWGDLLLSLLEVGLGLLLIFFDMLEPYAKLLAGGWAFIGGILLILQSLQRRRMQTIRSSTHS